MLGAIVFFLAFSFGWQNNTWLTVLARSTGGFIIFFLLNALLLLLFNLFAAKPDKMVSGSPEGKQPGLSAAITRESDENEEQRAGNTFTAMDFGEGLKWGDNR